MNKKLEQKLFDMYDMFDDHTKSMKESCMHWGCECGDGWYFIIDSLCKKLKCIEEKFNVKIIFDQVKEKYGTLRIYWHIELGDRWITKKDKYLLDGKEKANVLTHEYNIIVDKKLCPIFDIVHDQIDYHVNMTEYISSIICEKCGMSGATQSEGGWITTLCDKCKSV